MRLNRFFLNIDLDSPKIRITDLEVLNQVRNVLRLKSGDQFVICDGKLNEALVSVDTFNKDSIEAEVLSVNRNQNEPERHVVLYCSVLKKENFELVAQKATEVGVKEIVPIITERTVKLNLNIERLEKIIKEAAEQSGRGIVPVLHKPIEFEKALDNQNDINYFFDASGEKLDTQGDKSSKRVGVWIGPEGGWSDKERELATSKQFKSVSLGPLTFRAETAAITGIFLVLDI